MLCSICKKNIAVIFTNKKVGDKNEFEGFCYNCAKEKGINPLEVLSKQANLSEEELEDMTTQFESMFNDMSGTLNLDDINLEELTAESEDDAPIKSFISNIFGGKTQNDSATSSEDSAKKRVKTEKKPKEKKKSFLDIYGTNLTNKARKNELDIVIGRDKEIERVVQILNRRSKNNPCLIGEPGVRQNSNCSRPSN